MKRPIIIASITLGMLLAALDQMIMSTAMPEVREVLGGSLELYSWVFSAYMLASTITVPIYGKLADRYGRKRIYLIGLFLFLLGSVLCALSGSMLTLVLSRVVQGLGAGAVLPLTVTIAGDLFTVEERGKIQGLFSSMWALAGLAGPILGGWIIQNAHWSWIFWINIPVGLLAVIGFLQYEEQGELEQNRIDVTGALVLAVGIGSLLLATLQKELFLLIAYLTVSVVLLVYFFRDQKRKTAPLIRISMLQHPMVFWLNVSGFLIAMGIFVVPTFIPLYAQEVLGWTPLESGLILMGQVAGWNVSSVPAGKIVLRYGYRNAIRLGFMVTFIGGVLLLLYMDSMGYVAMLATMFVLGLGFGVSFATLTIGVQEAVSFQEKGISTSIQMFSRNLGTTIGVTLVGAVIAYMGGDASSVAGYRWAFGASVAITMLAIVAASRIPHGVAGRANG